MGRFRKSGKAAAAPTPEQLAKWRKLVETARAQADAPHLALGLSGLAHQLSKTPMPLDQRMVGSALHRLVEEARRFDSVGLSLRPMHIPHLRELADTAAAALGVRDAQVPARAPRFRADLDG